MKLATFSLRYRGYTITKEGKFFKARKDKKTYKSLNIRELCDIIDNL